MSLNQSNISFTYRYVFGIQSSTKDAYFNFVQIVTNGVTYDLNQLCTYNELVCPGKIKISLTMNRVQYAIYIWFSNDIYSCFLKFYGNHPETKTDFIIRIDAENKKYELALYRQGLKEPVVISESAYQLIVFKNKFEDYRSENYNQPRGAWIW